MPSYRVDQFLGVVKVGLKKELRWLTRARNLPWNEAKTLWKSLDRGRVLRELDRLEVARKMVTYSWVLISEVCPVADNRGNGLMGA